MKLSTTRGAGEGQRPLRKGTCRAVESKIRDNEERASSSGVELEQVLGRWYPEVVRGCRWTDNRKDGVTVRDNSRNCHKKRLGGNWEGERREELTGIHKTTKYPFVENCSGNIGILT